MKKKITIGLLVMRFLYENIYEDGLAERVKNADGNAVNVMRSRIH